MSKVKVTTQGIIDLLNQGMSRDEIGKHLGLSKRDVKIMFQHPDLKGKQMRKPVGFVFDDEELPENTSEEVEETVTEETVVEDNEVENISQDIYKN